MTIKHSGFDIMIGVSTGQNTANVVPLLQLNAKSIMLIETSLANSKQWSFGCNHVLQQRGIDIQPPLILDQQHSSRIDCIKQELSDILKKESNVLFNLGGGQKAQQIAIWEVFSQRNNPDDRVCYANMDNGDLEVWGKHHDDLFMESDVLRSPLRVEEILDVFGRCVTSFDDEPKNFRGELFQFYSETEQLKNIIHGIRKSKKIDDYEAYNNDKNIQQKIFLWNNVAWLNKQCKIINCHIKYDDLASNIDSLSQGFIEKVKNYAKLRHYFSLPEIPSHLGQYSSGLSKKIRALPVSKKHIGTLTLPYLGSALFKCLSAMQDELKGAKDTDVLTINDTFTCLPIGRMSFHEFSAKVADKATAGFVFEEIFYDWFVNCTEYSKSFVDVKKNVMVRSDSSQATVDAEHDLLLATKRGTLVSIDAKTGVLPKKDLDARLYNLEQGSGQYAQFSLVVPLDQKLYQSGKVQTQLLDTLFKFNRKLPSLALGFTDDTLTHPQSNHIVDILKPAAFFQAIS